VHRNQDNDLADLTVVDADGTESTLHTTQHHPFWDDTSERWVDAKDLVAGHHLIGPDGQTTSVVSVRSFSGSHDMRDITVAGVHTYYVLAGDTSVLVHNCTVEQVGGADYVDSQSCSHVCIGMTPFSDKLAKQVGAHTFNGDPWGGINTASGRPLWMEGVASVARNGEIKLSVTLDGLFGPDGRTLAASAQEALEVNYARGRGMNEIVGRGRANGTAWELGQVGLAVRRGLREWDKIEWYWEGNRVTLVNPFNPAAPE
jgi:hypothetical protein